jgi:hypothetical protein
VSLAGSVVAFEIFAEEHLFLLVARSADPVHGTNVCCGHALQESLAIWRQAVLHQGIRRLIRACRAHRVAIAGFRDMLIKKAPRP